MKCPSTRWTWRSLLIVPVLAWGFSLPEWVGQSAPQATSVLAAQPVISPGTTRSSRSQTGRTKPDASAVKKTWHVIEMGGQRIGHSRNTTLTLRRDGQRIYKTTNSTHMQFRRFGQVLKMQTLLEAEETEQGDMLSFTLEQRNPPANTKRTEGHVNGDRLVIKNILAGRTQEQSVYWAAGTKSPHYQDRLIGRLSGKPGKTHTIKTYQPLLNRVTDVRYTPGDVRSVKLFEGARRQLRKVRIEEANLPAIDAYVDSNGDILKTVSNVLGKSMVTYTVSAEEAIKEIDGADLDIAVNTLIQVTPLPRGHNSRKAVYRITTPGVDPVAYVPEGPTQRVRRLDSESLELTVTAVAPPETTASVAADPKFLKSTRYLQSTDFRVAEHARMAAVGATRPSAAAVQMERYVFRKLAKKNFSTALASAAEVAKSLEGDCTEHAVLLAALLRANKIPSKIAVGLVYIENRNSFGGHMWTEAWLGGKWVPLDATLGRGRVGAGHIKLAESSFSDDGPEPVTSFLPLLNLLGNIKIEVVEAN